MSVEESFSMRGKVLLLKTGISGWDVNWNRKIVRQKSLFSFFFIKWYFDYEEKYNTVEDVFKNFEETKPIETTNPSAEKTFTFKFENGKCVEVMNAFTAV